MKNLIVFLMLGLSGLGCVENSEMKYNYVQQPLIPEAKDVLVGVSYYPGWWPQSPNHWEDRKDGHDWRKDWPGRVPLLGAVSTQELMDKEIEAAADHGVDFFAILWYYAKPGSEYAKDMYYPISKTVEFFMNSPNSHRMKFFVEVCNHAPFRINDEKTWEECIDNVWLPAMKHPSYLRIDGRPVIKIHDGSGGFLDACGGLQDCQRWVDMIRDKVREAKLGEVIVGGGNTGPVNVETHPSLKFLDFGNDYMVYAKKYYEESEKDYPYDLLSAVVNQERGTHRFDLMSYVPMLSSGYNPRPWHVQMPAFEAPTAEQWKTELIRMAKDLEYLPKMGLALSNGKKQKMFIIYAWNEFGEGGYIAPTAGEGYMKLEGIKEVFGVKKHNPSKAR